MDKFWIPNSIVSALSIISIVTGIIFFVKAKNNKATNYSLATSQAKSGAYFLFGGLILLSLGNMITFWIVKSNK